MPGTSELGNQTQPSKLSKSDQADLDAIDASVDRMRTFTSQDPYVLTIPHDVETRYRHSYQYQSVAWLHQTPFEPKEKDGEYTQYQTYVYHEHGKDMYVLRNSQPKEEREAKSKPGTAANTPNAGPKKKISLNAYKKKLAGGNTPKQLETPAVKAVDAPAKQAAVKGPVERVKAETDEVLAAVEKLEDAPVEATQLVKPELKRKRDDSNGAAQEKQAKAPVGASKEEPPVKRARTTSHPPAPAVDIASHANESSAKKPSTKALSPVQPVSKQPKRATTPPPQAHEMKANLPPRLSPPPQSHGAESSLPPKLSPLRADALPTRLSPTIPTNMEATLKLREQAKASASDSSAPNSTTKRAKLTPPKQIQGVTKRKSPIPLNAFRANSSSPAVRSDAEEKTRPAVASASKHAKTPELSQDEQIAVGKALKAAKATKPSLIVKLKFRKTKRVDVKRILNMPSKGTRSTPRPTPPPPQAPQAAEEAKPEKPSLRRRDPMAKGVAQRIGPPARKQEIKRYEPPGRRKDSTTEPASGVLPAKRKRSTDESEAKVDEPLPDQGAAPEAAAQSQEPPVKRQKVPEKAQDLVDPPPPKAQKTVPPAERKEEPPTASNAAAKEQSKPVELPAKQKKAPANAEQPEKVSTKSPDESRKSPKETIPKQSEKPLTVLSEHQRKGTAKEFSGKPVSEPIEKRSALQEPSQDDKAAPGEKQQSVKAEQKQNSAKAKVTPVAKPQVSQDPPVAQQGSKKKPDDEPAPKAETAAAPRISGVKPAAQANGVPTSVSAPGPESPTKRKKVPEAIKVTKPPTTPLPPTLESPAFLTSAQKSQQVTPALRKDHLSAVAVAREGSAEGNVHTPSSGASSTPQTINGVTSQANGITIKGPSSQPAVKTPTQQAWDAELKRLDTLGRDLKHAAQAHLAKAQVVHSNPNGAATEMKLAAAKSIESLLAYFLAFTAADEASLAAEPKQNPSSRSWRSLHGFFAFVKRTCEPTPLLLGLVCHLAVVFNAHILDIAQGTAKQSTLDVATEHNSLFTNARDADVKLDCDALREAFPKTWSRRARAPSTADKLKPGSYTGEYKIPLGVQTSPVRAARAGCAMLEEWLAKEKVEYEMKLKL